LLETVDTLQTVVATAIIFRGGGEEEGEVRERERESYYDLQILSRAYAKSVGYKHKVSHLPHVHGCSLVNNVSYIAYRNESL
jgi:hypothetical protein